MEQIQGLQLDIHILNGRGKHIQIQMFEKYKYGKKSIFCISHTFPTPSTQHKNIVNTEKI